MYFQLVIKILTLMQLVSSKMILKQDF